MAKRSTATPDAVAIYTPKPTGDRRDPFYHPVANLPLVQFHSDFDYYGVLPGFPVNKTINHTALAGNPGTPPSGADGGSGSSGAGAIVIVGDMRVTEYVLATHNKGYVPGYRIVLDGKILSNCARVQSADANRYRIVSHYATTTQIVLREIAFSSDLSLPAVTRTYKVLVTRDPSVGIGPPWYRVTPGEVVFGGGKFRSSERHLRKVGSGDTPWSLNIGPSIGYGNGGLAIASEGAIVTQDGYSGSFAAPDFIQLTIGDDSAPGQPDRYRHEPDRIYVVKDERVVFDTSRPSVCLIPDAAIERDDYAISFPDLSKNNAYAYARGQVGTSTRFAESARSYVTIINQEYVSAPITLGTVPAGTNYLDIFVKLTRTTDPSTWLGSAIPTLIAENRWTFCEGGSVPLEGMAIFKRGLEIYLDGTTVRMRKRATVKNTTYSFWRPDGNPQLSGWTHGGNPRGHLAHQIAYRENLNVLNLGTPDNPSPAFQMYRGGAGAASLVDTTNYGSVWTGSIRIKPGRYTA